MSKLLREPLLHFLLLGSVLFVAYDLTGQRGNDAPDRIVVTASEVEWLASAFARTWQRPPTQDEVEGLIRDRVREEVYVREALALGLDQDDGVVRRRLRQKLEFLTNDLAEQEQPTEAQLRTYLSQHPERFRAEPEYTFDQVYLDPQRHGKTLARDAATLLTSLSAGESADLVALGDSTLLERRFAAAPSGEIAKQFGDRFVAQLATVTPGRWQGPIESGFGVHLVFVRARTDSRVPEFAQVRDAVYREWTNDRRIAANDQYYGDLLARYEVTIEPPPRQPADKQLAAAP